MYRGVREDGAFLTGSRQSSLRVGVRRMDSFASTDPLHEVTVYDVRGNAIGTAAEIFGDASHEAASPIVQTGSAILE